MNLVADYISLAETRFIIRLSLWRSRLVFSIAVDALATVLVFLGIIIVLKGTTFWLVEEFELAGYSAVSISKLWRFYYAHMVGTLVMVIPPLEYLVPILAAPFDNSDSLSKFILSRRPNDTLERVYFASTFLTSIWLWVYLASALFIRTGRLGGRIVSMFSPIIQVRQYPLVALGLFGLFGFTVGCILFGIVPALIAHPSAA